MEDILVDPVVIAHSMLIFMRDIVHETQQRYARLQLGRMYASAVVLSLARQFMYLTTVVKNQHNAARPRVGSRFNYKTFDPNHSQ